MKTVYAVKELRVSSAKQDITGDSHEDQIEQIKLRARQIEAQERVKIKFVKTFKFTETASGKLEMQPVKEAIDYCKKSNGKIKYFFLRALIGSQGVVQLFTQCLNLNWQAMVSN